MCLQARRKAATARAATTVPTAASARHGGGGLGGQDGSRPTPYVRAARRRCRRRRSGRRSPLRDSPNQEVGLRTAGCRLFGRSPAPVGHRQDYRAQEGGPLPAGSGSKVVTADFHRPSTGRRPGSTVAKVVPNGEPSLRSYQQLAGWGRARLELCVASPFQSTRIKRSLRSERGVRAPWRADGRR